MGTPPAFDIMNPYRQFGINLVCSLAGITPADFEFCKAASDTLEAPGNDLVYGRYLSRIAAGLYKEAGKMERLEHFIYEEMSKAAEWSPELNAYIEPVEIALGRAYRDILEKQHAETVTKEANAGALNAYIGGEILGQGLALTPTAAKALMTLGVGSGAAAGALWHILNRHGNEDDDKLEAMKARIQQYDKITNEISHDLRRRGLAQEAQA